jgi:hypothetical protein
MPLSLNFGRLEGLIVLIGIVTAASLLLAFHLVATAGAVFYSQSAYAMTIAGVVWGMCLVEPKNGDTEFVIQRPRQGAPSPFPVNAGLTIRC